MLQKDIDRERFGRAAQAGYQGRAKRQVVTEEVRESAPTPTNAYPPGRTSTRGGNSGPGVGRVGRNGANS